MKASEVWTSVFGTLAHDFENCVNDAMYEIAQAKGFCSKDDNSFVRNAKDVPAIAAFIEENEVPGNPECKLVVEPRYGIFRIFIDGVEKVNSGFHHDSDPAFDWEVSEELAYKHADDYEISKDSLYDYDGYESDPEAAQDEYELEEGNVSGEYWEKKYSQYFVA